jgi:hypothetical protein
MAVTHAIKDGEATLTTAGVEEILDTLALRYASIQTTRDLVASALADRVDAGVPKKLRAEYETTLGVLDYLAGVTQSAVAVYVKALAELVKEQLELETATE